MGTGSVVWKLLASLLEKGREIPLPSPVEILLTFLSCPSIQSLRNVKYKGKIVIEERFFSVVTHYPVSNPNKLIISWGGDRRIFVWSGCILFTRDR